MLIPTWWSPQGPCRVNSFWLALGRLVSMRASSSFREQISIKTVLYRHFEKSFHKNTSTCYKISLSHKNQSISRRKIVVPMEHIFITDTFISTFSKLYFFKEELPFSSRAKGAPNLFNLSISSCVVHSIFTWVERTKRERRVVQPSSRVIICIPSSARPRASRRAPWPWGERARVLHNFTNRAYNRRCKTRLRFEGISISFSKWRGKGGTWPATSRKDLFFFLARIERPLLHRNFARC